MRKEKRVLIDTQLRSTHVCNEHDLFGESEFTSRPPLGPQNPSLCPSRLVIGPVSTAHCWGFRRAVQEVRVLLLP